MTKRLIDLFAQQPVAVMTGAGVSTDSGIPDYRGSGTPPRNSMNIHEYLCDEHYRRRYWAGASVHADRRRDVRPNAGHLALAELERIGATNGVITQNVDNLHREAGSVNVVELHGNGTRIVCVRCDTTCTRAQVVERFNQLNPGYAETQRGVEIAPDGDALVRDFETLEVPVCERCGSLLRPDIVYFGETVPTEVFDRAEQIVCEATALVIAGSSLAVNTGIRVLRRAELRGIPIAIVNRGPTAADSRADIRLEAGTTETFTELLDVLT